MIKGESTVETTHSRSREFSYCHHSQRVSTTIPILQIKKLSLEKVDTSSGSQWDGTRWAQFHLSQ